MVEDGGEMVEEYDEKTDVLLVRKVRKQTTVGKEGDWVYEVGQATEAAFDPYSDTLRASSSNPIFLRKDTPEHFQWRIRNLPYPADVYSVSVDHEKQEIVVRTSNKKYYKRTVYGVYGPTHASILFALAENGFDLRDDDENTAGHFGVTTCLGME
eukprot:g32712.t1